MARRVIGGEQHVAHLDRVAVAQDTIDLDGRVNEVIGILEVALSPLSIAATSFFMTASCAPNCCFRKANAPA